MTIEGTIADSRTRETRDSVVPFWIWLGRLLLLMVACGLVSSSHGADGMWDTKNYHIYNAFAAFHHRYGYDVAPAQQQSYLNPVLDYPFYFLIRRINDHPRIIAFLMGLPQGVNLWIIGLMSWRVCGALSRPARLGLVALATLIAATGAGTLPLVGSPTGDILVSVPVLSAFLMLMRAADAWPASPWRARRDVLACGLLAGLAVGAKPTAACYAIAFGAALLFAFPWRALQGILLRYVLAGFIGATVTGGYHALRLVRLFGSPLFPLANNVFHSRFWEDTAIRDTRFLPKSVLDVLNLPFTWAAGADHGVTAELAFRDMRVALGLSALVLALAIAFFSRIFGGVLIPRRTLALFVSSAVAYGVWVVAFSIYRYLLPIEMLSGVLLLAALSQTAVPVAVPVLMAAATAATWFTTIPLEWGHTPFQDRYVEVSAPHIEPGTMVLIVGSDPVAYLIPFLDPGVRWLSLDNNLLHPEQGNALVDRERDLIKGQTGPISVLAAGASPKEVQTVLSHYGLVEQQNQCGKLRSNLSVEVYTFCNVFRQTSMGGEQFTSSAPLEAVRHD